MQICTQYDTKYSQNCTTRVQSSLSKLQGPVFRLPRKLKARKVPEIAVRDTEAHFANVKIATLCVQTINIIYKGFVSLLASNTAVTIILAHGTLGALFAAGWEQLLLHVYIVGIDADVATGTLGLLQRGGLRVSG